MSMHVRIKPYDPKRGYVLRNYVAMGHRFQVERGWYVVDDAVAEYLRKLPSKIGSNNPEGPKAFDVCTKAEATAIDRREKKLDLEVERPNDTRARSPEHAQSAKENPPPEDPPPPEETPVVLDGADDEPPESAPAESSTPPAGEHSEDPFDED